MLFKHVHEKLLEKGFFLEYLNCDLLQYSHTTFSDFEGIFVQTDLIYDERFKDVESGLDAGYDVIDIEFNIGGNILFGTDSKKSIIRLDRSTIHYFDYFLDILTRSTVYRSFVFDYNRKVEEFLFKDIESFANLLETKYNFKGSLVHSTRSNNFSLFKNLCFEFKNELRAKIYFELEIVTWKKSIRMNVDVGNSYCIPIDTPIEKFEKLLVKDLDSLKESWQINIEYINKLRNGNSNLNC